MQGNLHVRFLWEPKRATSLAYHPAWLRNAMKKPIMRGVVKPRQLKIEQKKAARVLHPTAVVYI